MNRRREIRRALALAFTTLIGCTASLALLLAPSAASAQDAPVTMAPPVGDGSVDGAPADAQSGVFNWTEVPQGQQVPIQRATFDQGGYQLFDTSGETIIVPFANNNLYVMKFAVSPDGGMYYVNTGDAPVLYVPQGGYLVNATVAGARWYPFTDGFAPADPVYIGIAPSWDAYVSMGWYPHMRFWGGYWGRDAWGVGVFSPAIGLFIQIGGQSYHGWNHYHSYYREHGGWSRPAIAHRDYYRWAEHPQPSRPEFHGFGGDHADHGGNRFDGQTGHDHGGFGGGSPGTGGHRFGSGSPGTGDPAFRGGSSGTGGHTFGGSSGSGGHTFGGGSPGTSGHTFGGGSPATGGHTFGSGSTGNGNGHTFGGGSPATGSHTFGGGSPGNGGGASGANNHSFGGGSTGTGGHTFGGGSPGTGGAPSANNHSFGGGSAGNGGHAVGGGSTGGGGGSSSVSHSTGNSSHGSSNSSSNNASKKDDHKKN